MMRRAFADPASGPAAPWRRPIILAAVGAYAQDWAGAVATAGADKLEALARAAGALPPRERAAMLAVLAAKRGNRKRRRAVEAVRT